MNADVTSVTIGESVTAIGQSAFSGCTGLDSIYCNSTTPPTLLSTAFDTSTYETATLRVPEGATDAYKAASYWSNFCTAAQKASLVRLLQLLRRRYPGASVHGHREYAAKDCPCFDAAAEYAML